jgi:hypothetical protein
VLALSGDYPAATGYEGTAAPVFDLDSVGLLKLYADMNRGLPDSHRHGKRLERTNFFLGCVVTNHKRFEREVVPQYLKLAKKVRAGARFVINQIGWNARKDDEAAARAFCAGRIPGVVVTDELLALVEPHSSSLDRGRAFFIDLAARHLALAKAIGFNGAYLGPPARRRRSGAAHSRAAGCGRPTTSAWPARAGWAGLTGSSGRRRWSSDLHPRSRGVDLAGDPVAGERRTRNGAGDYAVGAQEDPVARGGELVEVGAHPQDRHPRGAARPHEVVDLRAGGHVDALGRLVQEQHARLELEPPGQDDLLLVAAAQARPARPPAGGDGRRRFSDRSVAVRRMAGSESTPWRM